ncbi:MAG: [FeFe] hydrogenase H-cluster radical SAM maturase HydE [Candidatus Omnitrophica bacterium]|nr:[FeFe] hydrogenase H-cluster radical SAM maturase HydE [Candidatus Omnitrophota bacterium]
MYEMAKILDVLSDGRLPSRDGLESVLALDDGREARRLFSIADDIRKRHVGEGTLFRGIVEFSSFCGNTCRYCGLNRSNKTLKRYRMPKAGILEAVRDICDSGIGTVVLQSGEDDGLDPLWLKEVIESIKSESDIAVTLCVGEKTRDEYRLWREAGADRYLLKIETSDRALYESLHPGMSYDNRLRCLADLKELGYETGSGIIVGLKGQTVSSLAEDILFLAKWALDMIAIGPFIPHGRTGLSGEAAGDALMTLKVIALTRLVTRKPNIPATTALGEACEDLRFEALRCGANVIMQNFTPERYSLLYDIYPKKRKEAVKAL